MARLQVEARQRGDFGAPGTSKFRGVSWNSSKEYWVVSIRVQGKQTFVGTFKDEIVAAQASDAAATQLLGANAVLNFPNADILSTAKQHTVKEAVKNKAAGESRVRKKKRSAYGSESVATSVFASADVADRMRRHTWRRNGTDEPALDSEGASLFV
jgi:hypothetical protein